MKKTDSENNQTNKENTSNYEVEECFKLLENNINNHNELDDKVRGEIMDCSYDEFFDLESMKKFRNEDGLSLLGFAINFHDPVAIRSFLRLGFEIGEEEKSLIADLNSKKILSDYLAKKIIYHNDVLKGVINSNEELNLNVINLLSDRIINPNSDKIPKGFSKEDLKEVLYDILKYKEGKVVKIISQSNNENLEDFINIRKKINEVFPEEDFFDDNNISNQTQHENLLEEFKKTIKAGETNDSKKFLNFLIENGLPFENWEILFEVVIKEDNLDIFNFCIEKVIEHYPKYLELEAIKFEREQNISNQVDSHKTLEFITHKKSYTSSEEESLSQKKLTKFDLITNDNFIGTKLLSEVAAYGGVNIARDIVNLLNKKNLSKTDFLNYKSQNPIHIAAKKFNFPVLEVFYNESDFAGFQNNNEDYLGRTPLHIAAESEVDLKDENIKRNAINTFKIILEKDRGIDPQTKSSNNKTALEIAEANEKLSSIIPEIKALFNDKANSFMAKESEQLQTKKVNNISKGY